MGGIASALESTTRKFFFWCSLMWPTPASKRPVIESCSEHEQKGAKERRDVYFVANDRDQRSVLEGGVCSHTREWQPSSCRMSISEDTLVYVLFPPPPLADEASCASLAACIHDIVPTLLPDFLWHRDPFQLKIAPHPDTRRGEDKHILEGRMRVGDAVDDEWCVVWLLREISKHWDIIVRCAPPLVPSSPISSMLASPTQMASSCLSRQPSPSLGG